jgi:hypothetical protein
MLARERVPRIRSVAPHPAQREVAVELSDA